MPFNLRAPGHHLVEDNVGLCTTNVSVSGLYVAVVSKPRTFVPGIEINKFIQSAWLGCNTDLKNRAG